MKQTLRLAACIAGLLAGVGAWAQVHQCKDSSGRIIYSDRQCEVGQSGGLVQRKLSREEILQQRLEATEAKSRKYKAQAEARESELAQERRVPAQAQAQPAPPTPQAQTRACQDARKELEYVSSMRSLPRNQLRLRTNAAITNVNAACGSNTPLIQEPVRVEVRPQNCQHIGGGVVNCF